MDTLFFKEPMVSLSFDDGRKDTFDIAYKIMKNMDLLQLSILQLVG